MKTKTTFLLITSAPFLVGMYILLTAYSSGSPGGKSGSPGDNNINCTQCHSGIPNPVTGWITTNIPPQGYTPGETYTVTATGTHTGVIRLGFECTAEEVSGTKTGTFAITDPVRTKLTNAGKAVTHQFAGITPSGNTNSWSFDWTAPASPPVGDITFYAAFNAANGNGSSSGDVIYTTQLTISAYEPLLVDLTVFHEGPFAGNEMTTQLNTAGVLPLVQPYSAFPWNYNGTESVTAIPGPDVVDWVLIELRDAPGAAQATELTAIGQRAAFLLKNGSVTDLDGVSPLQFEGMAIQNSLFAVVWHRNALGIMSAFPLTETGGVYTYDFSSGSGQVFGGNNAHKELAPGVWGMIGGDGNSDGQVNNSDKNEVWAVQAGNSGYIQGDFNLDEQVSNPDKVEIWAVNGGMSSQVPGGIGFVCGNGPIVHGANSPVPRFR